MKRGIVVSSVVFLVGLVALTVGPVFAPFITEGCTPGYWKNHLEAWPTSPWLFTPDMTLANAFQDFAISDPSHPLGWTWPAELGALANDSLLEALYYRGGNNLYGGARIMLRHAVAALLNAAHPDVAGPNLAYLIIDVRNVLDTLNRDEMLMFAGQLNYLNELGCPLGRFGLDSFDRSDNIR